MIRAKLFFLFFLICNYMVGQSGATNSTGARSNAVSNASINFTDVNALFSNQAGLAHLDNTAFTMGAERRFALAELNNLSAGVALPISSGTFGVSINYFGFEKFNETKIGLSYARKLLEKLSFGVQFDMLSTRIPEYGSKNLFTFELGFQSELLEALTIGVHIFNPVKLEIVKDEFLPSILRAGATYTPSKKLLLHLEVEKDLDFPFIFKSGIEYTLLEDFWLRVGVSTNPTAFSFGLGYQLKNGLLLDLASNYHQELGFTPSINIGYELSKKKK